MKSRPGNDRYAERGMQTIDNALKAKHMQTDEVVLKVGLTTVHLIIITQVYKYIVHVDRSNCMDAWTPLYRLPPSPLSLSPLPPSLPPSLPPYCLLFAVQETGTFASPWDMHDTYEAIERAEKEGEGKTVICIRMYMYTCT